MEEVESKDSVLWRDLLLKSPALMSGETGTAMWVPKFVSVKTAISLLVDEAIRFLFPGAMAPKCCKMIYFLQFS